MLVYGNRSIRKKDVKKALSSAIASVEMEGYVFTEYHKKLCEAVVTGKMTKQEMIENLLAVRS